MKQAIFTIAIILVIVGLLTAVVLGSKGRKADTQATQQPSGAASSATPALSTQVDRYPIYWT
jgi:hypothetical protein